LIGDIAEPGQRREAFNITLSMPRGTAQLTVQKAAREFAQSELADHKLVMVLHHHHANPHVHLSVRAESKHGGWLNPRKTDLQHWRETFANPLQGTILDRPSEVSKVALQGAHDRQSMRPPQLICNGPRTICLPPWSVFKGHERGAAKGDAPSRRKWESTFFVHLPAPFCKRYAYQDHGSQDGDHQPGIVNG
jgi:hypothetical protein